MVQYGQESTIQVQDFQNFRWKLLKDYDFQGEKGDSPSGQAVKGLFIYCKFSVLNKGFYRVEFNRPYAA